MRILAPSAVVLAALATASGVQAPAGSSAARLEALFGISAGQAVLLDHGRILARTLGTDDGDETAVFGAIRIAVRPVEFLERFRDVERFKRHEAVKAIGRFSSPPRPDDLSALELPPEDLDELRGCRPGDCKLKLPASWMERLRGAVDWNAGDWRAQAQQAFRELIVEYVADYLARGDAALVEYADKKPPTSVASEFAGLLAAPPSLAAVVPAFARHLADFPRPLPGAEDFVYWSLEEFGVRPVFSVTHVSTFRDPEGSGVVIGASKQIYASHYFTASLGLTIGVDAGPEDGPPAMYLFYVNRSRTDAFGGLFGGLRRGIVERRSRKGVETTLAELRRRMEAGEGR